MNESLNKYKKKFGTDEHPAISVVLDNLGKCMVRKYQGENKKALDYYERSLEIKKKLFNPDHSSIEETRKNIASFLNNQKVNETSIDPILETKEAQTNTDNTVPKSEENTKPISRSVGTITDNNMLEERIEIPLELLFSALRLMDEGKALHLEKQYNKALVRYQDAILLLEELLQLISKNTQNNSRFFVINDTLPA